jgi:hypothetical protein
LRQIVLGEQASEPRPPERLITNSSEDGGYVVLRGSLIGSSGDTVFLVTFGPGTDFSAPPPENLKWNAEDFATALPTTDPVRVDRPLNPLPSFRPPDPDEATVALLPEKIRGMWVQEYTDSGYPSAEELVRGLPSYQLALSAGFDPSDGAAAAGYVDGLPTFFVVVTRAPGLDRRTIVGAVVDEFAGSGGRTIETVDVAGRRVQIFDDIAMYADDELLYSMMYIDMGNPLGATRPPRPALRDLAVEIVGGLP